jgi:platelet-activating factor acetylhydrolase
MEPLPSAGPKPQPRSTPPELLVINSEGFTLWDAHFASLQRSAHAFAPSRVLTVVRAQHISFSDFPLIAPRRLQGDAEKIMGTISTLAETFFSGYVGLGSEELKVEGIVTRKLEVGEDEKGKKRLVGEAGDVVVHRDA